MDALFEAAESYFLARHYAIVEKIYPLLFDCLEIESEEGGYYFTTSDPQAALSTDLLKARKRYFEALCHLYTGETLAERIIDDLGEYRYIGQKPPDVKELFPEGGEVLELLEEALIKRPIASMPIKKRRLNEASVTRSPCGQTPNTSPPRMRTRITSPAATSR